MQLTLHRAYLQTCSLNLLTAMLTSKERKQYSGKFFPLWFAYYMAWKIIQSLQYQYDFHHRASVLKALNLFAQILDPINRFCIPQCTIALSDQLALFVLNFFFSKRPVMESSKTSDTCKWTNLHVTLYSYFVLPKESTRRKRLEGGDHATHCST